jgi:tetratricopeptide (TPR) repeat protein
MLPKNLAGVTPEQLPLVKRVAQLLTEFENYEGAQPLYQLVAQKGGVRGKLSLLLFMGQHLDVAKAFEGLESLRSGGIESMNIIQQATAILRSPADGEEHLEEIAITQGWIDRSLREDPQSVPLRLQQAELYDLSQQYEKATGIYRSLLSEGDLVGVGRAVVLNNLAYLLALAPSGEGATGEARKFVNEAVDLLGPQTDILDTRAMISIAAKQYEDAISDLNLAVIDRPTAAKFFHMAIAHLMAGQNQQAANAWKKAVELGLTRESVSRLEKEQYDKVQSELESLGLQSAQI